MDAAVGEGERWIMSQPMILIVGGIVGFFGAGVFVVINEVKKSKRKQELRSEGVASTSSSQDKGKAKRKPIQEFLPISKIEPNGDLLLTNDGYRRLIQVGNVNPFALSNSEARSIRDHFRTMFGMFHQPVQFIVRGRRQDLTDYRQYFSTTYAKTAEKWENDRLLEYGRHVEAHLVELGQRQRTIRENLFVTGADGGLLGDRDVDEIRRTLHQETDVAINGLASCRVNPQLMSSEETIESFQVFWNRERVHARARDAVAYESLREYLVGGEEVEWSV